MPFDRAGVWITPTDRDIRSFCETLSTSAKAAGFVSYVTEDGVSQIAPSEELVQALQKVVETKPEIGPTSDDFFKTISRLKGDVDIVIPIYGGLHVLKPCIESILKRTNWKYNLILIDDASPDPEIKEYLTNLGIFGPAADNDLLFNKKNRGFAATVNRGIAAGTAPYVCVMNSDVLATEGWLTRMLVALESSPKNCIVNPATNNTAMINVNMYPGRSYSDMHTALSRQNRVKYPEIMPTGFCFMFRRTLLDEIGPFDEAFGSYGEETDWWFRAIKHVDNEGILKGYKAVLADNCYMFHERGTSFSQLGEGEHFKQRRAGSERFHKLHPDFGEWQKGFNVNEAIGGIRTQIPGRAFRNNYKGNVAWAVKSTGPCGAMYYITDIVNELIEQGYNVKVCLIPDDPENKTHAVVGNLRTRPIKFDSRQLFISEFNDRVFNGEECTLFSAVTELTPACVEIANRNKKIRIFNHVQSWDVDLAKSVNREDVIHLIEEQYRAVPNVVVSNWIADEIKKLGGDVVSVIPPGINTDLFHERNREEEGDERITIGILLLQNYPFKGFNRGVEMCKALLVQAKKLGVEIKIIAIGPDTVVDAPGIIAVGGISPAKMADVLGREIDCFIDPAEVHSYGLPGLEAMYSGARFLCWENKGVHEYPTACFNSEVHRMMTVVANDSPIEIAAQKAIELAYETRVPLSDHGHHRDVSVNQFISIMFEDKIKLKKGHRVEIITPHLRKHGGPTTLISAANLLADAGNVVSMSMNYTDWNPEVIAGAYVPLRAKWELIPEDAEVVIINSDNPFAEDIFKKNPGTKFIMYKLSHNARFKDIEAFNLSLPWKRIITSTEWLRQACLHQTEDWEYEIWDEDKVTNIGWYHYGHPIFNKSPESHTYGNAKAGFRLGTLIHGHPLKGTEGAMKVIEALKKKYEAKFHAVGIGEAKAKVPWHMQYVKNFNRKDLANVFQQLEVWLGASHTEGLGRMSLEAMSAGAAVVTTDTGAEFLKDGENCLLYKPGDMQTAGTLINKLVNDTELFQKLVVNGYKTAVESADYKPYQEKLNKVVREIVNG